MEAARQRHAQAQAAAITADPTWESEYPSLAAAAFATSKRLSLRAQVPPPHVPAGTWISTCRAQQKVPVHSGLNPCSQNSKEPRRIDDFLNFIAKK